MTSISPQDLSSELISRMFINPSEKIVKLVENEFEAILKKFRLFFDYRQEDQGDMYEDMFIEDNMNNFTSILVQDIYQDDFEFKRQTENPVKRRYSKQMFFKACIQQHVLCFEIKKTVFELLQNL